MELWRTTQRDQSRGGPRTCARTGGSREGSRLALALGLRKAVPWPTPASSSKTRATSTLGEQPPPLSAPSAARALGLTQAYGS